jgi:hypothetical protein
MAIIEQQLTRTETVSSRTPRALHRTTHLATHLATRVAAGLLAVFGLMGADGDGCNIDETPVEPPPPACPEGTHAEYVCDENCGMGEEPSCYETCVPDQVCPEGTYEEWYCDAIYYEDPEYCLDPMGCPPPEPGECYPVCVPIDVCGYGYHEEIICDPIAPEPWWDPGMGGAGAGMGAGGAGAAGGWEPGDGMGAAGGWEPGDGMGAGDPGGDPGMGGASPGGECYSICVPDLSCEPGTHEEWICPMIECEDPMGCPGECTPVCVPDACPPGTIPVVECDEFGFCWETCVPIEGEPAW